MPSAPGASLTPPVRYPSDSLTEAERARLAPHVTDLDGPVFALVNLPETVKGALFARYSRYPGTLRRLFLEEFADSVPEGGAWDGQEGERAAKLYERIFVGYGDDSVAQLGGAHVACEWVSNVLTKVLQRPRLGAYLEQSTRYIAYDAPMPGGGYRFYRDAELGPEYEAAMDSLFDTYAAALPRVRAWVDTTFPRAAGESESARARAVNAKAFDLLRGLLPAASLSHMGIYATGQTYEQLILHLIGHPLPEARHYGELILAAIKAVMPSFVARVERPDRGGAWAGYLADRRAAGEHWAGRLGLREPEPSTRGRPSRSRTSTATRSSCWPRCCSRPPGPARSGSARRSPRSRPRSGAHCSPTSSAAARTAATVRAAASRRSATASRSSRITARSATSSATGCSRCSGRA